MQSKIKKKIDSVGKPLKEWTLNIYRGILTGLNEAFIISGKKREELIAADPHSADIIRPILRGRDIKKYRYTFNDLYVILAEYGSYEWIEDKYPAIYEHLHQFKDKLELRGQCRYKSNGKANVNAPYPGQHHWLELDNNPRTNYLNDFSKPKLIFQEMVQEASVILDTKGFYCLDTGRILTGENLEYLVGLMNSNLFFYAIKAFYGGGGLGKKGVRMKHTFFGMFSAYEPTAKEYAEIKFKYDNSDVHTFESYINHFIYNAYGLIDEEIQYIEQALTR